MYVVRDFPSVVVLRVRIARDADPQVLEDVEDMVESVTVESAEFVVDEGEL